MMNWLRVVLGPMALCSCAGVQTGVLPIVPHGAEALAEVQSGAVVVIFPSEPRGDTGWGPLRVANPHAGYFWHLGVRTSGRGLAAGLQVDPDSALQLPSYRSLRAVIAAAHLRSCRLDSHVITCADPIEGRAWIDGDHVVIAITDRRWRSAVAAEHPDSIWLSRGQENLRYNLNVTVPLTYR